MFSKETTVNHVYVMSGFLSHYSSSYITEFSDDIAATADGIINF